MDLKSMQKYFKQLVIKKDKGLSGIILNDT